jgi:hypothetical protein
VRLLLTAGFDRALHAVALAELARREGHVLAAVLVATPFSLARARGLARQRGIGALAAAGRRMAGTRARNTADGLLEDLLEREDIAWRSLRGWARDHGVPCHSVRSLNSPRAVRLARAAAAEVTLYAGGGVLRAPFLEAVGGRVLNAHSGPLPHVRGMNACEWSLLLGHAPEVTIHVIDQGIDTGAVIERIPLPIEAGDTLEALRGRCAVLGVHGLLRALPRVTGPLPARASGAEASRQCFVLAPVLRELLERRLGGASES